MQNSDGKDFKHGLGAGGIEAFLLHIEGLFMYWNEAIRSQHNSNSRDSINLSVDDALSAMGSPHAAHVYVA